MMVAALSFTACGDDDEEGDGGINDVVFSITIDGITTEYSRWLMEGAELWSTWSSHNGQNYLRIGTASLIGDLYLVYPYGIDPATYFSVGYSDFEKDAIDIKLVMSSSHSCDYVSGSAKVSKNDGEHLVVEFSNYKFTWYDGARELIFDGTHTITLKY